MGQVKHLMAAKFKDEVCQERIDELINMYAGLKSQIPLMKEFVWGKELVGNRNDGYMYLFTSTFDSVCDKDTYLQHPLHKAFTEQLRPTIEKMLIWDYHPIEV